MTSVPHIERVADDSGLRSSPEPVAPISGYVA